MTHGGKKAKLLGQYHLGPVVGTVPHKHMLGNYSTSTSVAVRLRNHALETIEAGAIVCAVPQHVQYVNKPGAAEVAMCVYGVRHWEDLAKRARPGRRNVVLAGWLAVPMPSAAEAEHLQRPQVPAKLEELMATLPPDSFVLTDVRVLARLKNMSFTRATKTAAPRPVRLTTQPTHWALYDPAARDAQLVTEEQWTTATRAHMCLEDGVTCGPSPGDSSSSSGDDDTTKPINPH